MRVTRFTLCLVLLALPLHAQDSNSASTQDLNPLSLSIGDQIRVREPLAGDLWLRGTVTEVAPDAFTYAAEGDASRHYFRPYESIDTIAVKRRIPRESAISGALWGAFIGAAAGIIAGPFYARNAPLGTGPAVAVLGVAGGLGGAGLGAAAGVVLFPQRWFRHVLP